MRLSKRKQKRERRQLKRKRTRISKRKQEKERGQLKQCDRKETTGEN